MALQLFVVYYDAVGYYHWHPVYGEQHCGRVQDNLTFRGLWWTMRVR